MPGFIQTLQIQTRMFLPVLLATGFSLTLWALRASYSGSYGYYFLIWNLFLAWIPWLISTGLACSEKFFLRHNFLKLSLVALWWLFFPNALYLVTDFLHLTPKHNVPLWFDVLLILSFAWAGLLLGFLSLRTLQEKISHWYGNAWAWCFAAFVLLSSSFGIYLGRFLRWNSWDVFVNPVAVLADVVPRLFLPFHYPHSLAVTILFFGFFFVAYLAFYFRPARSQNG